MSSLVVPMFVLAGIGAYAWGQSPGKLTARELFFVPAEIVTKRNPKATQPKKSAVKSGKTQVAAKEVRTTNEVKVVTTDYSGPRPFGLRYSVLKVIGGKFQPVAIDSVFHSGDGIKVRVESNEDGYLYVYSRRSNGQWVVLFPNKDIREGSNGITAGDQYDLPSPKQQWTMDDNKGEERLYVVLSRKPLADLDKSIYDLQSPVAAPQRVMRASKATPMDDKVVALLQAKLITRDLVLEKVDEPKEGTAAPDADQAAGYVVNTSGLLDASVAADIRLKHQ
jgi:hypothetical protein